MNGGEGAALAVSQAVTLWVALTPSIEEAREVTRGADSEFERSFRTAEIVAGFAALSVGAVAAALSHSATPLIVASMTVAGLAVLYEYVLSLPGKQSRLYVLTFNNDEEGTSA